MLLADEELFVFRYTKCVTKWTPSGKEAKESSMPKLFVAYYHNATMKTTTFLLRPIGSSWTSTAMDNLMIALDVPSAEPVLVKPDTEHGPVTRL
jgi:hypothetical protein